MIRTTLRGLAAATLLLAIPSMSAGAQQAASSRFGLKAGISLPTGDFGDGTDLGFHVGGHAAVPLSGAWGLRFDADFGRYGAQDPVDNVTVLGGVANLTYRIATASELKPYLLGGVGYYNWKVSGTGGGSVDDSDLAWNVGIGYDFALGGSKLFTELRYLSIQSEGSAATMLPIVVGLRF